MKRIIWYALVACSVMQYAWGMTFDENAEETTEAPTLSKEQKNYHLYKAAEDGDMFELREMISQGADIHSIGGAFGITKITPLAAAARSAFDEGVEVLLAQPGVTQEEKDTALVFAAKRSLEAVKRLLAAGANKNAVLENFMQTGKAETPLSRAVDAKQWDIVDLLIERGETVPAEYKKRLEVQKALQMLVEKSASLTARAQEPQPAAAQLNDLEDEQGSIKEEQAVNELLRAVHAGDEKKVHALIAQNENGKFPLFKLARQLDEKAFLFAAEKGYVDIVEALKEADVSVGEQFIPGTQKLKARNIGPEFAENSPEAKKQGKEYLAAQTVLQEALKLAVTEGQKEVVAYLLTESDITPEFIKSQKGEELLMLAMNKKNATNKEKYGAIFSLLVRAGAPVTNAQVLKKIKGSQELRGWYNEFFKGNTVMLRKLFA